MAGRISSGMLYMLGGKSMQEMQAQVAKTQQQLATGKKILSASDDPIGTSSILNYGVTKDQNTQFQRNADSVYARLQIGEDVLAGVGNGLQRIRELTIQGNNDSNDASTRRYISREIANVLNHIAALANSKDLNDEFIFSGAKVQAQPFEMQSDGSYLYMGDDVVRNIKIGSDREISSGDTGRDMFVNIPNGNGTFYTTSSNGNTGDGLIMGVSQTGAFVPDDYTVRIVQALPTDPVTYEVLDGSAAVIQTGAYTSGASIGFAGVSLTIEGAPQDGDEFYVRNSQYQDVFATVQQIVDAFDAKAGVSDSDVQMHNIIQNALSSLDQAMFNVQKYRAENGARLNAIEEQKNVNETIILTNKINISRLQDLDYFEAISRFQQQMTSFQAAQQSYVQIQSLTLFKLL